MVIAMLVTLVLPLVASSQTNAWEVQGDALLKMQPELAVKLYAKALLEDGATVESLTSNKKQEPYLVAMERVLDKLPWAYANADEFLRLMEVLKPVLKKEFTGKERKERVKQLVSKYKLLRHGSATDEFEGMEYYVVPVVDVATTAVETTAVETTQIQVTDVPSTAVFIVTPDVTGIDITDIPVGAVVVVQVPIIDVDGWVAVYDLAFGIMGEEGLYRPHSNSPLGLKYEALEVKLTDFGPEWKSDPTLLAEWIDYWTQLKAGLDRRAGSRSRR